VGRHALRCAHCGTEKAIPAPTYIIEWLGMPPDLSGADAQGELIRRETLRCRSCGATTEFSSRASSLSCPYCGSPQVVQSKGQVYLVPPRALIPFEVDEEGAKEALHTWLAEGYWHPDDLVQRAELVELHGTYLPFWGFKGLAEVTFQLQGASLALDTMPMVPSQQTQHINVRDLLIPGSLSMDARTQRQIEPFDLDQAVPFRPEYLAGWPAEVYQVALADATIEARGRMSKEARSQADALTPVLNLDIDEYDIGGIPLNIGMRSRQRNRQVTYKPTLSIIRLDSFMHYVLPVWVGTYRYRGHTYAFAVNGQTGKAGGEAPRGGTAGTLTIVLGVVIVALVGVILWRFWPTIVSFFQSAPQTAPEGTETRDPETTLYLGMGIMVLVVFALFGVAAQWKKIKTWFGRGEERKR
jgi:DNA-directed RNA polymerase subunit RPC12/RpoP